ncbi:hypothetical protein FXO38_22785 [Capsicum annuum]|uniref:Ubiquitin-like protease family profile domain-containing protein n=1 Tax=Capsicum annuum TaxID=4072 RepID=A0A2G3AGY7_CAPAN|nr:hypothetical protein FXO38_22785 [Capsicum annuum]KAF3642516.1 hypothetical protein FXO37_22482 [Capsicum annuum]PHT93499.1 hypothetical protein T459_01381 [Capsicum annuum]
MCAPSPSYRESYDQVKEERSTGKSGIEAMFQRMLDLQKEIIIEECEDEDQESYTDEELDVDQPLDIFQPTEPTMRDDAKIKKMVLETKEEIKHNPGEDSSPFRGKDTNRDDTPKLRIFYETDKSAAVYSTDDPMDGHYFDWNRSPIQQESQDVEGCSENNATASLDALVEFVVNHNSDNTNIETSTTVHVHSDHMDVERVSADIGPAILECLVAVVENQKPDNDNVRTSTMHLDVILKVIAAPVDDVLIEVVPPSESVMNQHDISDSQLPLDFSDVVVAVHQTAKIPSKIAKRIKTKFKVFKSQYTTEYASGYKTIEDQIEEQKQQFAFDGFLISDTMPSSDRCICVYDSLSRRRNTESITEIQKLAKMLPTYLSESKFYDETSRTDWPNLETYRDKITQMTLILNEHPFDVEYVQHIMQQECDSVDYGIFVVGYAEYLSEEMNVPFDGFEAEYHRMRYATLLQKYGIQKSKKGYVSENDDPPRPKSRIIQISDENEIVCIE